MKKILYALSMLAILSSQSLGLAAVKDAKEVVRTGTESAGITSELLTRFSKDYADKVEIKKLKADTLALNGKAVPALVEVMKNKKYPDRNRWMATFLLGQVMGAKSAPYIAKYSQHPDWVMRMASLKTLLALKQEKYGKVYVGALKDSSYIVRVQALENIKAFNLKEYAPHVWAMLYDKQNYHAVKTKKGQKEVEGTKRTHIVRNVVRTVGDLQFQDARPVLLSMIQKDKYKDIFEEMDYALVKITGKKSPEGTAQVKKLFWKRTLLAETTL